MLGDQLIHRLKHFGQRHARQNRIPTFSTACVPIRSHHRMKFPCTASSTAVIRGYGLTYIQRRKILLALADNVDRANRLGDHATRI